MKKQYRLIRNAALALTTLMALAACTLMDNDLRDLHDIPGYDEVVHVETPEVTADYQYQDNTIVMDERFSPYIQSMDYTNNMLYLYDFIPDEMLPKVGQPLVTSGTSKLEWGLLHKVVAVSRDGQLYALTLEQATLDDTYKTFSMDGEWDVEQEVAYDFDPSDSSFVELYSTSRTRATTEEANGNWHEFDLIPILSAIVSKGKSLGGNHLTITFPDVLQRKSSGDIDRGPDALACKIDATGSFLIRFRTLGKCKKYLTQKGHKLDAYVDVGTQIEIVPQLSGSIELSVDFYKVLESQFPALKAATKWPLGEAVGLPIWFCINPSLVFDVALEGSISYKWTKTFRTVFGAYNNIPGHEDGVYYKNRNTPVKREPLNEKANWESESDYDITGRMEFMAGIEAGLVFGSPYSAPNVGFSLGPSIGARFKFQFAGKKQNAYDKVLHFGVPLKVSGKLFLNIWEGVTLDWDFVDAIAKALGREEGAEIEIVKTDFRVFPSIDNLSITCTNKDDLFKTPVFWMSFNVLNQGMKGWETIRPVVKIHLQGQKEVIATIDNFKPTKNPKSYSVTINNPLIMRGGYYDAEVCWVQTYHPIDHYETTTEGEPIPIYSPTTKDMELCSKRFAFSTASPTVVIDDYTLTMQKRYYSEKKVTKDDQHECFFDFSFRTHQRFTGRDNIDYWGFDIGKKTYTINLAPASDQVAVIWKLKHQPIERKFTIAPFLVPKNSETKTYGPSKTIEIKYDEANDEYSNGWEVLGSGLNKRGYYISGFDNEKDWAQSTDYTIGENVDFSRNRDHTASVDTIVVYLDDLLDDEDNGGE